MQKFLYLQNKFMQNNCFKKNRITGFFSSLLISISSLMIGWIPPQELWNNKIFFDIRLNYYAILLSIVMMVLGIIGLFYSWLSVANEINCASIDNLKNMKKTFYFWMFPLIFSLPMFSRDIYAYIAQGRLVYNDYNPYAIGTSVIPGWSYVGADPMWTESLTPYGPLFLFIAKIIIILSDNKPHVAILLFRILALIGVLLMLRYIPKIALHYNVNYMKAIWSSVLCPLLLLHFIVSCHNDALMMGFLIAGLYYMLFKRPILGLTFLSLSISIKPISLIALPFFGLLWARSNNILKHIQYWFFSFLLSVGPVFLTGICAGWGILGWAFSAFSTPGQSIHWYAPVVIISNLFFIFLETLGIEFNILLKFFKLFFSVIACIYCMYLLLKANHMQIIQKMLYAFIAVVISSSVIHPWYILWIIILWSISGIDNGFKSTLYIWVVTFFLISTLFEPIDISVLLKGETSIIPWIIATLVIIGICYFAVFNKNTKTFFFQNRHCNKIKDRKKIENMKICKL